MSQGLDLAITKLWPKVDRRYYCKYLARNWKMKFPDPLMFNHFWKASGPYSPFTFKKEMEFLHKTNSLALVWLMKLGSSQHGQSMLLSQLSQSDVNKIEFVERFNSTIGIDRCTPILTLLEGKTNTNKIDFTDIRRVTMVRMATRSHTCEEWKREDLFPNITRGCK